MKQRTQAREMAFQVLYQIDINQDVTYDQLLESLDEDLSEYSQTIISGVLEHQNEIDQRIDNKLEKWSFNRIGTVEKTVLRIAVYEMTYEESVPSEVAINEAVEISKRYNEEQSGKFVNGVLSKFIQE